MTARTISTELATRATGPGALIKQYENDFATVLPAHIKADTFVRLSQGLLRRNPDLATAAQANPASFLAALLDCARLGHEPGTDQYALTWFKNTKTGKPDIVGIEQYQGEIERMYRAGAVQSVKCEIVRFRDDFAWAPTRMKVPHHEFNALASDESRGELTGVYAYAHMIGGALSQVVVMGRDEIMRHKAVAKTTKFWEGPWEPSMWKKTAIHELEKWVPTSAEYLRERLRSSAEASRVAVTDNAPALDVVDGEVVDTATGEILPVDDTPLQYDQEELNEAAGKG